VSLLPILLLVAGSMATLSARRQHERVVWAVSSGAALIAWLVSLGLVVAIPLVTRLSVWRPTALFDSRLELHLDSVGWYFLYATATITLSISLTEPVRSKRIQPETNSIVLAYSALAMVAMLAGNLLTVATTWALMDFLTLLLLLRFFRDSMSVTQLGSRLAVDAGGVLVILAAALVNRSVGGSNSLTSPLSSPIAAVLIALAVFLRLGLIPFRDNLRSLARVPQSLGTLLILLPAAAALSVLARLMNVGVATAALPWLRIAGGAGLLLGGLRWSLGRDVMPARLFMVFGLSGLGVLVASLSPDIGGEPIAAASLLLLLAGTVFSLTEIFAPPHRIWSGLAGLMLAGLPGTAGGVIASSLGSELIKGSSLLMSLLVIVGMAMLAMGAVRQVFMPTTTWPTGESLARVMYSLGLALPILVGFGVGLQMPANASLGALIVFGCSTMLVVLTMYAGRRLSSRDFDRWMRWVKWLDLDPFYRLIKVCNDALLRIIRLVGGIMEGEGAVLWMMVLLLLLILGFRTAQ
jgi:hypothetical protein